MESNQWHRSGPRMLALTGCVLVVISAFIPWLDARSTTRSYSLMPGANSYTGVPVWILLLTLVTGGILLLTRDLAAVLSAAATLWTITSVLAWSLGSKLATLIPNRIVPGNAELQTSLGIGFGLAGGLMILVGCIGVLVEQTWPGASREHDPWITPVGATLGLGLLAVRDVGWLHLKASQFDWKLRVDAIPFFGDVLVLFLLVGAIFSLWLASFPRRWVSIVTALAGLVIALTSTVALLAQGWATKISGWMVDSLSDGEPLSSPVRSEWGPISMLICGVLLLAYGAAVYFAHSFERTTRHSGSNQGYVTVHSATDPFSTKPTPRDPFA